MSVWRVDQDFTNKTALTKMLAAMPNHIVGTQTAGIRWLRLLFAGFGITLLFAALCLVSGYASILYAHKKAQRLLAEVQKLVPGKTTVGEVTKLVERYGGEKYDAHSYYGYVGSEAKYASPDPCLGEALSYEVFASPPLFLMRAVEAFPQLQKLGLHPWFVNLAIHHKNGIVTCYSEDVVFIRPDGQEVEGSANLVLRNTQSLVEQKAYQADSFVSRNHYHKTRVDVLREASVEEKARAFQMDLSCTVSFRGCYFPCQIIPLGWVDSVNGRRSYAQDLPEGTDDPRCPTQ